MSRSRNVADTQDNNGGAVPPFAAGKNKIINGDFGIWQRGTSFTNLNDAYGADRFKHFITASAAGTYTITRETFTPGTAPVAGYESQYFMRVTAPSSGTITEIDIAQIIEDVRTFAGQTITFSFWAKSSANLTLKSLGQQRFGSGGSANVNVNIQSNSVTTSWQRFTHTMTVPSLSGKTIGANSGLWFFLYTDGLGAIANSQTIDLWGWQVEAGNTATAFQTATGTLAGELAACFRYYINYDAPGFAGWSGYVPAASSVYFVSYPFYTRMRVQPTVTIVTSSDSAQMGTPTVGDLADWSSSAVRFNSTSTGTAENRAFFLVSSWTASAEL